MSHRRSNGRTSGNRRPAGRVSRRSHWYVAVRKPRLRTRSSRAIRRASHVVAFVVAGAIVGTVVGRAIDPSVALYVGVGIVLLWFAVRRL